MCCRCFSTWTRSSPKPCPRLHGVLYKVMVVFVVLIVLQYSFSVIVKERQFEPLFSKRGLIHDRLHTNINDSGRNVTAVFLSTDRSQKMILNAHKIAQNSTVQVKERDATLHTSALYPCPAVPPNLNGPIKVSLESPSLDELEMQFPLLNFGGRYSPRDCQARSKVAIIVPYRDRAEQLRTFLLNLHPLLQRQQLDYGIYVVEQAGISSFNRAMLMNVGFVEALKQYAYDCFIFHDVDLIPEDDRNLYTCSEQPRHMSVAINVHNYRLPYKSIFGGVSALTTAQFRRVNGFSNMFWGWGGEDDDMSNRLRFYGFYLARYPASVGRYKMLKHRKQHANPKRITFLKKGYRRYRKDGLSSLHYKVKEVSLCRLFTKFLVELAIPTSS